jgi:hypothetical protein
MAGLQVFIVRFFFQVCFTSFLLSWRGEKCGKRDADYGLQGARKGYV